MAISDEIFVIAIGYFFSYAVLYRKHRLLGGIGFLACGIALMSFSMQTIFAGIGLVLTLGALILLISDILSTKI